jgi:hypothetical protein
VHALSVPKLDIPDDATAALTGFMVNATTIAKASFTSTYARPVSGIQPPCTGRPWQTAGLEDPVRLFLCVVHAGWRPLAFS